MTVRGFPLALPLVAGIFAAALTPLAPLMPSAWAAEHLRVVKGPRAGGPWDPALTPYVAEIIDALAPTSPVNKVAVRKSAQTGLSIAGLALAASYAALRPNTDIGYALPTVDLVTEFNRDRLQPTIDATPALRARIRPQISRAGEGSTATSKLFKGGLGSLTLINSNSAADLRAKSLKVGIADEIDQWAADLAGQGDPLELYEGRFISFHATGDWKLLEASTPTAEGASRIDAEYQAGDRRLWHVKCPACDEEIPLLYKHLQFERKAPHRAHYAAQCCGGIIEHYQKAGLVRAGRFVPTNAGGLYPSFHVDALISQLTTWDKIAEKAIAAEGDERKMMAFHNLWLGLSYAVKGDAPDWQRLFERREAYPENSIPPLGLLLVAGADVQHSGIWLEVVAYAPDRQSWTVRSQFIGGDTTDPNLGAFAELGKIYDETFSDAWGNKRRIERMAIDAGDGGRANQVYAFARHRTRALAVKGVAGWTQPAIAGQPTKVSITLEGKRLPGGAMLWPVGTWSLKAVLYDDLRKDGRTSGRELDPPGYCHHGTFIGEQYFRQLTAESLKDVKLRGRTVKAWVEHGPNHALDARIYAMAAAEQLGLTRKSADQWRALAAIYSLPVEAIELFASPVLAVERAAGAAEDKPSDVAADFARAIAGKKSRRVHVGRRVRSRGI